MATTEVLDLRDYVQVVWRRRRLVVATAAIVTFLALILALVQSPVYRSATKVLVLPVSVPGQEISPNQLISMPNELEIATSATVSANAVRKADAAGVEAGTIEVTSPTETQTLEFQASARDARAAQVTATEYADAYIDFRQKNLTSSIDARIEAVDTRLGELTLDQGNLIDQLSEADSTAEATALQFELNSVNNEISLRQQERAELDLAINTEVASILQTAELPLGPASPRPLRNLILGAVLGLMLGVVAAIVRDRLDQRIRSREDVEAVTDVAALGLIPEAPTLHRLISVLPGGDPLAAEAFRALRARVLFGANRDGFRAIMVTSATEGEGKTATTVNLAVALAQADTKIVLVSGDMHRPGVWRYLPERGRRGLADVLAGGARLQDVLVQTDQDNLVLLPSGTLSKLPEAALGSADMLKVLEELLEDADLVLMDSAPVLGVADTLDMATLVDGVVLAVDASHARKDLVREAAAELRSVGASIVGVVLVRPDGRHFERYSSYKYGRRETLGDGSEDAGRQASPTELDRLPRRPTRPAPAATPVGARTAAPKPTGSKGATPAPPPAPKPPASTGRASGS
jgi:capsular exopolysaccharide synthesis family protein